MIVPPLLAGAVHDTVTLSAPGPAVAVGAVIVAGTPGKAIEAPALAPAAFVAVTVTVYCVSATRLAIVHVVALAPDAVQLRVVPEVGTAVAVNPVIADPPFDVGTVQVITSEVADAVAEKPPLVGAPGTVRGVRAALAVESAPVPTAFVASTTNVYAVPFVNPLTTQLVADDVQVKLPGDEMTWYAVIADPPFEGAVQLTVTWPLPTTPVTDVGAPGTVTGMTAALAAESAPVPAMFVASTTNVYDVPFVSPVTVHDVAPVVVQVLLPGVDSTV